VSARHNALLRAELDAAARGFPDAEILFLDTYNAYLHVLANAAGFNITDTTGACDAADALRFSGPGAGSAPPSPPVPPTCANPRAFVSWDSVHMTDATYGILAHLFATSPRFSYPFPNFVSSCAAAAQH
jgi:phospholipase/lecithinase/hemolysin